MSEDFQTFVEDSVRRANACYVAGMQAAQGVSPDRIALNAILRAYDKALTYENTTIPSALMAAIEAARKV